ncbi:MAG: hypothetical protein LBU45_08050 [Azoarcus sp.]|nr:hypothetical protein [Azoarcus sp.]
MAMKSGWDVAGFSGLPGLWLSAWTRPWSVFGNWNERWSDWNGSWWHWLEAMATQPVPWMPALAAGRQGQPEAIGFFLPWLPRIEATITPLDSHSDEAAVRVMLRATLPGGLGGDCLEVDAKVRRHRGVAPTLEGAKAADVLEKNETDAVKPADNSAPRARRPG